MPRLSIYVHFPWCLQKCPYCDFASSGISRPDVPHAAYADAVLRELDSRAAELAGHSLHSVFFGGGTPSLWSPAELGRVLGGIRSHFPAEKHAGASCPEVTVECNPTSLDQTKAALLREAGVNRLSIGVQSLNKERLRFLGRLHDGPLALQAVREAMLEMPRVSADLMFGMPGQAAKDFLQELQEVTDLGLEHLSVYALTIETETQFGALHRKGKLKLAPEGDYADTFIATEEFLAKLGLAHYEVSNYAKPGQESVHNLHYWRGGSYLGLGAGAVGCLRQTGGQGRRYRNHPTPKTYMNALSTSDCEITEEQLNSQDTLREGLMLGLRTAAGIHVPALSSSAGEDLRVGREEAIDRHIRLGNILHDGPHLRVPRNRWLHLDGIIADLF